MVETAIVSPIGCALGLGLQANVDFCPTRTKYEARQKKSRFARQEKSVLDVCDPHVPAAKNDPDHVEPEGVGRLLVAGDPYLGGSGKLALFPPAHRAKRTAERIGFSGLYLDEGYHPSRAAAVGTHRNQIDVAVTVTKAPLGYLPAVDGQPFCGHLLSPIPHCLPSR